MAAHPIRIEAPIPGKSLVGIEVPNKTRSIVSLRNLIANPLFQSSSAPLLFVLGRNVAGLPMYADMSDMPHLLVAGSTGTGKTIFLNSLILSLLYRNDPGMMKLILIDPKRVEFQHYNHLPHLLCPVIYDAQKTINALSWLVKEMERRFEVFSEIPTRNLDTYNKTKSVINSNSTLLYIVLIIDELADLMAAKGREIEGGVVRLAQMARATGIHLVLATQRPSVEVITGLIKANVTSRTTFQVASQIDSRTVLDMAGAEKLLGAGDMLFVSAKSVRPRRMQAPYVSEEDVKKVSEFIGKQNGKSDRSSIFLAQSLQEQLEKAEEKGGEVFFEGTDPLYEDSKRLILETKKASASFLQRRLKIGYARAARLIDILEEQGFVGPADGAKPREVFGERFGIQADQSEETNEMEGDGEDEEWGKV
ncbi:DNA translocase FtsK [Patescibacteria group bacterium]|nr:DNA translocase FtsK [Patescibacteria group bacterium]